MVQMVDYIFVMLFEFAVAVAGLVLAGIPLLKRHLQRKTRVSLYLNLTVYFLLAAVLIAGISRIVRMTIWLPAPTPNIELLAFSVICVAISDLFMLAFTLEVFYEKATSGKNRFALFICVACVAAYGVYTIATGLFDEDLNDIIWLLVIILSVIVAMALIRSAARLSKKVEDPVGKWGLRFIAVGPVFLISTYALFLVDSFSGGKFSPFYYAAWIMAIVAVLFLYIGFVQPDWFKKRFQRKYSG